VKVVVDLNRCRGYLSPGASLSGTFICRSRSTTSAIARS